MWEHAPMEKLAGEGELYAYKHEGSGSAWIPPVISSI